MADAQETSNGVFHNDAEVVPPDAPATTAMAQQHLLARVPNDEICGQFTMSDTRSTPFAAVKLKSLTNISRTRSDYPHCIIGIKEVDGRELTAYKCGRAPAVYAIKETIEREVTETETDDQGSLTIHVTTLPPVTVTVGSEAEQTGRQPSSGHSVGGSEPPIGAIVGGVVGGVALIALVAFGLWFIRFQKRKAAAAAAANAQPNVQSPPGYLSMAFPNTMQPVMYEYPASQRNTPVETLGDSGLPKPASSPPAAELPNNSV
ncbi:hypothetical protein ACHAPT_011552 [Fusarium lateritium]